jgi:hypothetical protein
MLYDAQLELELADGTTADWRQSFGLRRWETYGRDLFRERKRVVLRGAVVEECSPEVLQQAVDAELALVVRDPVAAVVLQASELGVVLVADLRQFAGDLTPKLLSYSWQPAVALVLLDEHVTGAHYKPRAARIACGFAGVEWADVIVLELDAGERPPAGAADCPKPVIAIRRGGAYAELGRARQECDRLQAELAPQFDLAGYFA